MAGFLKEQLDSYLDQKSVVSLQKYGIEKVEDLLRHFPKRYEDRSHFQHFPAQAGGEEVCVKGLIIDHQVKRFGGKRRIDEVIVEDSTHFAQNRVTCRWFNMPYIGNILAAEQEVILYGRPKEIKGRLYIDHPEFEIISVGEQSLVHLDRIVPVYPNISGVSQRRLREILFTLCFHKEVAALPPQDEFDSSYPLGEAFQEVHFPGHLESAQAAKRYFALEEFTSLQVHVLWKRMHYQQKRGYKQAQGMGLLKSFYESLPFDLTGAQKTSVREIISDMRSSIPMNRLLQGDVGSGKTFVAMCAMILAIDSGHQAALMAPTQILAEQHYLTFKKWLEPLGVRLGLVTGSKVEGDEEPQMVIGTHALLFDKISFKNLSLVVVDEQHKFGVLQRNRLAERGQQPDVLVMTATPIPRSLALTIYGDLDVSVIDQRPSGRGKIVTAVRVKPKISDVTAFLKTQLEKGRQSYLVYPLVEDSEKLSAQAATTEYEKWVKRLNEYEVGLLHGKLPPEEKEEMMTRFRDHEVNVLVSTSVIEVGVDVANANLIVIFNAERFGLAQLHQLRGRVGRGEHPSYCILVTDGKNSEALQKLEVLEKSNDGFVIAEEDLKIRGPGDVLGIMQSGLGHLRFGDYLADPHLLKEARERAQQILAKDPSLSSHQRLREGLEAS